MVSSLTALDMMVLIAVVVGAGFGLMRGFVSEVFSLGAWFAAAIAVGFLHAPLAALLAGRIGTTAGAAVLAFALIFGPVFFAVRYFGRKLGRGTHNTILGPFDRILGFGFGALKGIVVMTIAFLFVSLLYDTIYGRSAPRPIWMTASRSYPLLRASGSTLVAFVEKRRAQ